MAQMTTSPQSPASDPGTQSVGEAGERALIERIRGRIPQAPSWVIVGVGDDAAVVEPERNALEVITTDALVEGVHFDRAFVSAADIGHKALAVNLSDLAAMGATPRVALLSLMLPAALAVADVDSLVDAMLALAQRSRIFLVGGNITRSPGPLIVDVTVTGSVHRRRILTRGGARAGDELYVTGSIGGAAAGFRMLSRAARRPAPAEPDAECVRRYLRPEPRLRFGMLLGRNRAARACIDLSDGLADGVRQIAEASGTGAVIDAGALPVLLKAMDFREALGGGEDYELLFAASPKLRRRLGAVTKLVKDLAVTRIGRLTGDRALVVEVNGRQEELPRGFAHFSAESEEQRP
jgi:thiamine-monophosphate kinase